MREMKAQSRLGTVFCSILTLIKNTQVIAVIDFRLERKHIVERSGTLFAFLSSSSFRWHGWLLKKAGRSASGGCSDFGRDLEHRHDQSSSPMRLQCQFFGHPSQRMKFLIQGTKHENTRHKYKLRG